MPLPQHNGKLSFQSESKRRTYYLVKFIDIIDGILIQGFRLFTGAELRRWMINLPARFPERTWVGGSHYRLYETYEEYTERLLISEITERKYNYLQQQFGQRFGNFL